jgi:ribosomal protein L44E
MEDSNANQATSQSPIISRPSPTARRSGGPRTAEGKRRSCRNARRHGLYTDERFLEGAALELGDDPRQFQRLLNGLIGARRPVGALEMALVEDIALVLCKKARADRSELAVQVSNLHQHDLERRKQMIQVGHANSEASEWDVREHGLRRGLSSPGQYEQVLGLLGTLMAMIDFNEFDRMKEAMRTLYGTEHTLRGAEMDTLRYKLSRTEPQDETFEPAKKAMMGLVAEELAAVGREYEIFLHEHVENTRSARMAATAPSQAQWAAIIRQQNSLNRQLEQKIRLLMELQRERKNEAQLLESLEASSPPDPSDPLDGATRAGSCRRGTGAPAASHPSATGMAQTSSCEVCDVPKGQAGTGDSIQPFVSVDIVSPLGIRDPTRQALRQPAALLIWMGAVLGAAFKNIKNRGNELKDLLQRQGITEIVISKRTHFCAERAAIGAERSGISRIVGGRLAVPWAGAILDEPG